MDKEKLKPCPFCGGKANLEDYLKIVGYLDDSYRYNVTCYTKGCKVFPSSNYFRTKKKAIEAWNRRVK